eukprot:TRINITY_DN35185_c0_g1_i1.p1 TRINITY_DN35185_c0_g1~~TRINITY_DN35185_c0_g1_i1.p1  ORF type:complete len:454 (+),score=72.05 TRINITY_DN35185_c0_g1_i1:192-1553(+)
MDAPLGSAWLTWQPQRAAGASHVLPTPQKVTSTSVSAAVAAATVVTPPGVRWHAANGLLRGMGPAVSAAAPSRGAVRHRHGDRGSQSPVAVSAAGPAQLLGVSATRAAATPPLWARLQGLAWAGSAATTVAASLRRLARHRLRVPARRAQSPAAEIAFGCVLVGSLRVIWRAWDSALSNFRLRDQLFKEMAVAHTYRNSVTPWIQTGVIAVVASVLLVLGLGAFIRSMKEWENRQELKEMQQMGEDAVFLMSTPLDATPLQRRKKLQRKKGSLPIRFLSKVADWLWLLRLGACVGYLLPLLNVLDFGEISISLYPYALGVPPTEPIVNFMQNTLKLRYVYNAYLKSGYYFLIVWFLFIQFAVRNKAAPFYVRFHSSQAILISMLLGLPQQVFFAVLNPWESGLMIQTFMYHSMVTLFLFVLVLVMWCCLQALLKRTMTMPLVSEAAVMWAGRE